MHQNSRTPTTNAGVQESWCINHCIPIIYSSSYSSSASHHLLCWRLPVFFLIMSLSIIYRMLAQYRGLDNLGMGQGSLVQGFPFTHTRLQYRMKPKGIRFINSPTVLSVRLFTVRRNVASLTIVYRYFRCYFTSLNLLMHASPPPAAVLHICSHLLLSLFGPLY